MGKNSIRTQEITYRSAPSRHSVFMASVSHQWRHAVTFNRVVTNRHRWMAESVLPQPGDASAKDEQVSAFLICGLRHCLRSWDVLMRTCALRLSKPANRRVGIRLVPSNHAATVQYRAERVRAKQITVRVRRKNNRSFDAIELSVGLWPFHFRLCRSIATRAPIIVQHRNQSVTAWTASPSS